MKKTILLLITLVAVVGLIAGTSFAVGSPSTSPNVVIANPVCALSTPLVIMGSGYEPGQEVNLILSLPDGNQMDIGYALDTGASPVANELGAWATAWDNSRWVKKKIVTQGVYTITATDTDYIALATAPFGFYDPESEELPAWAQ